jgi:hypothetical protein
MTIHEIPRNVALALEMLRGSPEYVEDARAGAPVGNSVVGSLLSLPPHSIPRQYAEQAVAEALRALDREAQVRDKLFGSTATLNADADEVEYTLPRTGQAPLRFRGTLVAESDGERQLGREHIRWHELAVYRTAKGRYVVRIAYRTRYQGELDRDVAEVAADAAGVAAAMRSYDPGEWVRGYPDHPSYADRQESLLRNVRRRYEAQVTEILACLPGVAEEVE